MGAFSVPVGMRPAIDNGPTSRGSQSPGTHSWKSFRPLVVEWWLEVDHTEFFSHDLAHVAVREAQN